MSDAEPRTTPGTHLVLADADDPDADAKPYQEAEVERVIWRSKQLDAVDIDLSPSAPQPQRYSLIIRWSDADECFIAWVPEFGVAVKTHGATYAEAAAKGQEVVEMMSENDPDDLPLPHAWTYGGPEEDERIGRQILPTNIHYRFLTKVVDELGG